MPRKPNKQKKKSKRSENNTKTTRREFIEKSAVVGAGLMVSSCTTIPSSKKPEERVPATAEGVRVSQDREYQYIIVGAGAGGGPLAVRLAKMGYDVLLLDAGGNSLPMSAQVPAFHVDSTEDNDISWNYNVRHRDKGWDKNLHRYQNIPGHQPKDQTSIWYPRATGIGGCTNHNAMIAMTPHSSDWEKIYRWAKEADGFPGEGAESWSPERMRSLFDTRVKEWHHLEANELAPGFQDSDLFFTLIEAAKSTGSNSLERIWNIKNVLRYGVNEKHKENREGLFMIPKSTRKGHRYSVYHYVNEYIGRQRGNRENKRFNGRPGQGWLTIKSHSLVKKVNFVRENAEVKATGVTVAHGTNLYRAHDDSNMGGYRTAVYKAHNEVILSAGAFNTPQILMLSGIGSREHFDSSAWRELSRDNGENKKWLELEGVGKNLQDRYEVSVVSKYSTAFNFIKECDFKPSVTDPCFKTWKSSPWVSPNVYSSNGVVGGIKKRSSLVKGPGYPQDLIMFGAPGDFRGYQRGYSKKTFGVEGNSRDLFSWAILKGYSHNNMGRVKLKSSDFRDTPDIHFNYFGKGKDKDLHAVYEAVEHIRKMNGELGERIEKELFPGPGVRSKRDVKAWIEREAWGHHASCTARMGLDPIVQDVHGVKDDAVVDYDFKVHGTSNLRVVDASVFPEIPGLFIAVPIYMIAERAADVINEDYKRRKKG